MQILLIALYALVALIAAAMLVFVARNRVNFLKSWIDFLKTIEDVTSKFKVCCITVELFLLQVAFVPLFVYFLSLTFAKMDVPVDVWRLMRSTFILGFPVLFVLVRASNYYSSFLISTDPKPWRLLILTPGAFTLSLWLGLDGFDFSQRWRLVTDAPGLEKALFFQIKAALLGITGLIIIYATRHSDRLDRFLITKKHITFVVFALLSTAAVFFPHIKKDVLNSETFLSPNVAQALDRKFNIKAYSKDVSFTLKCSQAIALIDNFDYGKVNSLLELYEPENIPDRESTKRICEGYTDANDFPRITWQTNTARPHELCFVLFKAELRIIDENEGELTGCISGSLLRNLTPGPSLLADKLRQLQIAQIADVRPRRGEYYSLDQVVQSYSEAADAFLDNKEKWKNHYAEVPIYLGAGSSTGFYTHHYAVILQSFIEEKTILSYAANQYGFGPLMIARGLQELGATKYDSVMYAVFVGNAAILLAMFFLFWNIDIRRQIILFSAFILSVGLTFWQTNLFAPMTYHIRLLPSLVLFLYLTKQAVKTKENPGRNLEKKSASASHILFAIVLAIFNFEYGLLTAFGMVLAAVTTKKWQLTGIYSLSLVGAFAFKSFAGGYSADGSGTNVLGYVSSYWVSGPFDLYLVLIASAGLIPVAVFMFGDNRNRTFEEYAIGILFFMIMFKPAFVGSSNHGGSIFITTACLAAVYLMPSKHFMKLSKGSFASYLTLAVLCIPMFLAVLNGRFPLGRELSFQKYQYTAISDIMPVSTGLATRMLDAESIFADGDLALTISDSALALWTGRKVAQPFFDVSSSVLMPLSRPSILDSYSRSKSIVVDKIIDDTQYRSAYLDAIKPLAYHGMITPRYWMIVDAMIDLWDDVKAINQFNYKECGQSLQFVRYCIDHSPDLPKTEK